MISDLDAVEAIASGREIQSLKLLNRRFGRGRWRKMKGLAKVELETGEIVRAELHWYEAHGRGRQSYDEDQADHGLTMAQTTSNPGFVVYLGPADNEVEMQRMKLYRLAKPQPNDPKGYLRVIDDSGENYLYPKRHFAPITVPRRVAAAARATA